MDYDWVPLTSMKPREVGGNLHDTWAVYCQSCTNVYPVRGELVYRWLKQRSALHRFASPEPTTTDLASLDAALTCPQCNALVPAVTRR